ncbi:MAG: SDR family NAD(P)-dependent oxidoreductase [Treponema sp.]|nr:SDR family NAD(P)-dependent oxidoreductase [Treponema sp.]
MKRIAIITGASSGMGAEFARQIAHTTLADQLWLIARRTDRLNALVQELQNNHAITARAISLDISGRDGVERFKNFIETQKQQDSDFTISLLINNAGFGTYGTFESTKLERQLEMIELNCITVTGICGICLPLMQKGSTIINVASLAAVMPLGNFAVYGATKAYVRNFTLALAAEVKDKGIAVCALCPGSVSTEFANVASNGARKEVLHGKPADKVVAHCLKKALHGKHIAMMAPKWKFNAFISRFVSHYFGARMTYLFSKRPSNPF